MDKVAIVTGGSRGIGREVAKKLAAEGFKVIICSRHILELKKTVSELKHHGSIFDVRADVSKYRDCQRLVEFAKKKFGRVDLLVNNAAVVEPIGSIEAISHKDWDNAWRTNVLGVVNLVMLVVPIMKLAGGGKIICFAGAGVGSPNSLPNLSAYYTSKTAVVAFTEVMAEELRDSNIQINAISPGRVVTKLTQTIFNAGRRRLGEQVYQQTIKQSKDPGMSPELIANMVLFLSSAQANHITGRLISVKWDRMEELINLKADPNLFRIRRIDKNLFYEAKG